MNRCFVFVSILLLSALLVASTFAQSIGDYVFTNSTSPYTDLGTNGTVITTATLDDAISAAVDIGFTFKFGATNYTQFKLNTNGWITFNTASTSTTQYVVLSSTETQVVAALSRDLLGTAGTTEYRSFTTGSAPNHICEIQWKNLGFYNAGVQAGNGSFQIWLYETSNKIEIHYATFNAAFITSTVQVGAKSASTATTDIRSLSGTGATTWTTPTLSNSAAVTMDVTTAIVPDSGRTYTFTPFPMAIVHTPLTNNPSTSGRLVSADITSSFGIPTGPNAPRTYYRTGTSGAYTALAMTNTSGNIWQATIPGQPGGSIVQYYIAAQDLNSTPNVVTSPGGGSGINPPGTTPPSLPYQYIVTAPLSGAFTINKDLPTGGGNYSSFAEALSVLNASGVAGPTTFTVTGTASTVTYAEGNLILGGAYVSGVSPSLLLSTLTSTNTLTFVAASGKTINMSGAGIGAADYVFRLQGVDWVTFDGINIVDTATTPTGQFEFGYVLHNASSNDGATNNTIKNFSITLNKANTSLTNGPYGVAVGNGTTIVTFGLAGTYASRNNNNKIQNFTIQNVKRGIAFDGLPIPAFDEGNEVSGPPFTSATGGVWVGGSRITNFGGATSGTDWGISIDGQKSMKVFNVQIDADTETTAGTATSGIHFGTAASTADGADNVEIYNCVVHGIVHTTSLTSGAVGIRASGTTLHTVKIYNTAIYDIQAPLATGANVMVGMLLTNTGAGTKFELYNNSINITAPTAAAGVAKGLSFALAGAVITAKNNAIAVTGGGSTGGAIALDFGATSPTLLGFSNNVYNVGTTGPTDRRMAVYGSANRQNLIDWQSTLATPSDGVDQRSAYGDPGFNSGTDITYGVANRVNDGGVAISGLSTTADILGATRSATAPDVGVFEGNFTSGFVDAASPGIAITPLEGSVSSEIRVIITDNVNSAGHITARLWYRLASSAPTGAFSVFGPNAAPIDSSNGEYRWGTSLRSLAPGLYEYYIVVRDAPGNSYADPTMLAGSVSPGFTTAPADPNWAGANPFNPGVGVRTFQNAGAVLAGGTYLVGVGRAYPTLTAVANEISTKPISGNVVFELDTTYDGLGETFPIVFNQPSYTVAGPLTITIRPAATVTTERVTAGNPGGNNNLIYLDGARDLILDGRPGGAGTSRMWRISNIKDSAAANASGGAIQFQNDALRNTLRWLTIESNTTSGLGGVVNVGSTFAGGQGNNFNTISNCEIRSNAAAVIAAPPNPIRGIAAVGGGTNVYNKSNTYSNNLIHDFHSLTANPVGLFLAGEVGATITGNSFYQTAPRSGLAAFALGLAVNAATGPGITVTNNFFGGTAPQCGGTPMTIATLGATAVFYAMQVNVGQFTTPTTISGNTITNMDLTSANTTAGLVVVSGVNLTTGSNQVPVFVRNNVIGNSTVDATTNPAIVLTSTGTALPSSFSGYFASAGGVVEIVGNSIGGVKLQSTSTGTTGFIGIQQQTNGIGIRVDSNLVGSSTVANNIVQNTNAPITGIANLVSAASSMSSNTVANGLFNAAVGGTSQTFTGISGAGTGPVSIVGNTVRDIVGNNHGTVTGINMTSSGVGSLIKGNVVRNFTINPQVPATSMTVQGIFISSSTSTGQVLQNLVHSLINGSTSTGAALYGMNNQFGANWIYANNMVSLGTGSNGDIIIRGVYDFSTPPATGFSKLFYNSVYITGAVPGATTNTTAYYNIDGSTTGQKQLTNNIFADVRTGDPGVTRGFAFIQAAASANIASDYNVFKTVTDTIGQWLGTTSAFNKTLADWQTATAGDAHTVVGDPGFISVTDLHILTTSSVPSNNGTPLVGIVGVDFDNQARSTTTPDRGADEYTAGAAPIGILSIARNVRVPFAGDTLVVTARIIDSLGIGITADSLLYSLNGTLQPAVTMPRISGSNTDGTYRGVIPGSANTNGTRVEYQIKATGAGGSTKTTAIAGANSYFAGISPLSASGVRTIDSVLAIRYRGYYARVTGTINGPNFQATNLSQYFQDGVGGMQAFFSGGLAGVRNLGDSIMMVGHLDQFRGVIELIPDSLGNIQTLATGRPVPIADLTINQYNANPEPYESMLIRFTNISRKYPGVPPWPPALTQATIVMYQTNLTDTVNMFINAGTNIPGSTEPSYPVTMISIGTQFTSSGAATQGGYEVLPRYVTDFTSGSGALVGNYTIGTSGNFATLSAAIAALTGNGVAGAVTFQFTDASYTDTAQIITGYSGQSPANLVTFKPANGVTPRIVIAGGSTVNAAYGVRMDSVSGIVWDGSNSGGTDRSMTIETDTNTTTARTPFFIRKGSRNVTLKNLIVEGNRHSAGGIPSVVVIDNTGFASSGGQNNMTVTNCQLMRGNNGIFANAASGAVRDSNHTFTNNLIGGGASASVLDHLAAAGISLTGDHNVLVDHNDINGIKVAGTPVGLRVNGANTAVTVTNNRVHNLVTLSGAFRPLCILVGNIITTGPGVRTQATIANNMFYDIHNFGAGVSGRAVDGLIYNPTGGVNSPNGVGSTINWYYNTWNIDYAAGEGGTSTAFFFDGNFAGSDSAFGHSDSIGFFNNVGSFKRADSLQARMFLILQEARPGNFVLKSNNNDYYYYVGPFAQIQSPFPGGTTVVFPATLSEFRDSTRLDSNSVFGNPQFASTTDGHISTVVPTAVESGGRPIAGITTDFDGDARNATTPDIGADEGNFLPLGARHDIGVTSVSTATLINAPGSTPLPEARGTAGHGATASGGKSTANTAFAMTQSLDIIADEREQDANGATTAAFIPGMMPSTAFNGMAAASETRRQLDNFSPNSPINFRALVHNFGNYVEPAYQVGWTIDGSPQTPASQPRPLQLGATDTVGLTWATPTSGSHVLRAFTVLASDSNRVNDTATYNFSVAAPGVVFEEGFNQTIPPYPTGWTVKNLDGGGTTTWFQGNPAVFPAFEGTSYIGANFQAANGVHIDEWLVTPNTGGLAGSPTTVLDSLIFWQRDPGLPSYFPDSIQIRVSTTDTAVASFTIVLDYFRVDSGSWQRKAYALPNAANRFIAFRYLHYNGGSGPNSNYIGLDLVQIRRTFAPTPGWETQTSGVTGLLYSVKAVDQNTGWIAAAAGRVLRTTNTGGTWSSVGNGRIGAFDVYAIDALDANTAFATTTPSTTSYIFRTTNGGALWDTVYTQSGGFIDAIKMFDANNGMAIGDPVGGKWTIVKTSNGGATWVRDTTHAPAQAGTEAGSNNGFASRGSSLLWFPGNSNSATAPQRVYRSTDGGLTWAFSNLPFASSASNFTAGIDFVTNQIGVVGNNNGLAARTTDGGATWSSVTIAAGTTPIYGVAAASPSEIFATMGANVYRSSNLGVTWAISYTGAIGTFNHASFVTTGSNTRGYAITQTAGIAAAYFGVVGVTEPPAEIPQAFAMMQNYPNPFNPTTTLRYALPKDARVTLSIFNILGQRVATLRDEVENVGYYNVVWNGRNDFGTPIASGVYFYRIEARPTDGSEAFSSIKKMLMLK